MKASFNDFKIDNIKNLLAGYVVEEQEENKFNLVASPDLTFNDAMQLIQTMTYQVLFTFAKQKPEALEDIYDAYNFMASTILENLIPDKELRQDITEDAILELEAKKIEEAYASLSEEDKKKAIEKMDAIKKQLTEDQQASGK